MVVKIVVGRASKTGLSGGFVIARDHCKAVGWLKAALPDCMLFGLFA
jgi:hypothetical protein